MDEINNSKNSLSIAFIIGLAFFLIIAAIYIPQIESINEKPFGPLYILVLIIFFFGSTYWLYQEIEYNRKKWKAKKRPWHSWIWWPSRKWEEAYYWRQITRLTIFVPFLVYIWVVLIIGYSTNAGIVLALISFLLVVFTITELHHLHESRNQLLEDQSFQSRKTNQMIIILLFGILFIVIFALPYIEGEPRGNYMSYQHDQSYIGQWSNLDITIIFEGDHTLTATYDNENYSGTWHTTVFGAEINWFQELKLPHPNDPSYLYSIEEVYVIDGGNKLSLYTPFDPPSYLTLNKIVSN